MVLQVMCDEAHFLKNGEAQITQAVAGLSSAKRRLLMSGKFRLQ
jgi:SNF2 family DNA or RNA helicase